MLADTISMNIICNEGFREAWQKAYNSWYSFFSKKAILSLFLRQPGATRSRHGCERAVPTGKNEQLNSAASEGILHLRQEKEE